MRSSFVSKIPHNLIPKGCRACERTKCRWCKKINQTTTSTSPNTEQEDFYHISCSGLPFVMDICIIECNICKLQCIGKSETAFKLRLNNHINHIKKGVNSFELAEHVLHNTRTRDFDDNVTITIIEQIKKDRLETDRKKSFEKERFSGK